MESESGVVLLETVLTMPFYMLMTACLFWVADLCLTHTVLVSGEHLRIWERGTRHLNGTVTPGDEVFSFLAKGTSERHEFQTGQSDFMDSSISVEQAGSWGKKTTGHATVKVRRSGWSWFTEDWIVHTLFGPTFGRSAEVETGGAEAVEMTARRSRGGDVLDGYLLSRNADTGEREVRRVTFYSGNKWHEIYGGIWEDGVMEPAAVSGDVPGTVTEYVRPEAAYLRWSE